MQQIAWQISLALMILVAIGFTFVALNSGRRANDYTPLQIRAYRIRTKLFWVLVLVLGPAMLYNLRDLPYSASHARTNASGVPILVLTDSERTYRQLALVWGVIPELVPRSAHYEEMFEHARASIERRGLAQRGDRVLVTAGVPFDMPGTTNLLRVEVV